MLLIMFCKCYGYFFMLIILAISNADPAFSQPVSLTNYYETSFLLKSRLILIEAEVNEQCGYFVIDTGCPKLVINKAGNTNSFLASSDLYTFEGEKVEGDMKEGSLVIGHWETKELAILADLSPLEQKVNMPLLGIIGMEILKDFEIHLNYRNTTIAFFQLAESGKRLFPSSKPAPIDTIPLHFKGHLACIKATMHGEEYNLGLDLGAGINVFSKKHRKHINNIFAHNARITGMGKQATIQKCSFFKSAFQLGNILTLPMLTILDNIQPLNNNLNGQKLDGLLGFEFFFQQEVALNFKKRELYLWERKRVMDASVYLAIKP